MVGIVLLGVFVLLLAFGAPIAVCLGASSMLTMLIQSVWVCPAWQQCWCREPENRS